MIRFKAKDKETGKIQKVVFIDWETTFVKLGDGSLTDFKHVILLLKNKKGDWEQV